MRRSSRRALLASLAALIVLGAALFVTWATEEPAGEGRVAGAAAEPRDGAEQDLVPLRPVGPDAVLVPSAVAAERVAVEGEATAHLTVRVKLARGPVAGAVVRVLDRDATADDPRETTTDRRGRARQSVPPDRAMVVEVEMEGDGVVARREVVTPAAGASKTIVVDLGRVANSRSIAFEVISVPSGTPLAGADAIAYGPPVRGRKRVATRVESDARGHARLPWTEDGGSYEVRARGHSPWSQDFPARPSGDAPLRVELVQYAHVSGTLAPRRANGGARSSGSRSVHLDIASRGRLRELYIVGKKTAQPDAEGNWRTGGIPFRSVSGVREGVRAVVDDGRSTRVVATDLTIRPGDRIEVADVFDGAPGFGLAVLQRGDVPWPGRLSLAFVPAGAPEDAPWLTTLTDADGEVEIDRLPMGRWDVYDSSNESRSAQGPLATIDHDGAREQTIVLSGFVPVEGEVVGADGSPPLGAEVMLHTGTTSQRRPVRSKGEFLFPIVEAGAACTIEVIEPLGGQHLEVLDGTEGGQVIRVSDAVIGREPRPIARVEFIANGEPITIRL
ncbi:MAG: hypothetical protein AAGB93_09820 [Planctomycetota bacterium]